MNPPTPIDVPLPPRSQREQLVLTRDQACDILDYDQDENRFEIVRDIVTSTGRWTTQHRIVIKRLSDGRFFSDRYVVGSTEQQHEGPWEHAAPDFREVFPVEVTKVEYR